VSYPVEDIEGVGPAYAEALAKAGIKTTEDLLAIGAARNGRGDIAAQSGLSEKLILKWVNHADLMRISGVGGEFAELLEAAGVDTVKELQHRNAENLAETMKSTNEEKNLTRVVPSADTVAKWIEQAKGMEPAVSH
jgi:predicted flap endonuclease-1-like 5' DNA nuclease